MMGAPHGTHEKLGETTVYASMRAGIGPLTSGIVLTLGGYDSPAPQLCSCSPVWSLYGEQGKN